jgi:hypothetical protein
MVVTLQHLDLQLLVVVAVVVTLVYKEVLVALVVVLEVSKMQLLLVVGILQDRALLVEGSLEVALEALQAEAAEAAEAV